MTSMMSLRTTSKVAQGNKQEIMLYGVFTVLAIIAAATCLSQLVFSAWLTLGSGIQCLGFALLMLQAHNGRDVSNVSLNSLVLYVVALCFRLFANLQYLGYQPLDEFGSSGVYHTVEIVEMFLAAGAYVLVKKTQNKYCCFSDETPTNMLVLLLICGVLAPLTHSYLNASKLGDTAWTMGLYVETVAMIPQLYLLQKTGGKVDALHGHYIASTFFSRLTAMWFWSKCYTELKPPDDTYNVPGSMVIGAQALQVVVFADFMYLYVKSLRNKQHLLIEM